METSIHNLHKIRIMLYNSELIKWNIIHTISKIHVKLINSTRAFKHDEMTSDKRLL